jgi:tRNA pseudouridine55 synthase
VEIKQRELMVKDGLILIYKSRGMTSKDVSRWFQKRFGKIKIGHVGTLDPLAEGVLPILLGKATRLQDFLLFDEKVYEFDVTFGYATDTLDTDGTIVTETDDLGDFNKSSLDAACLSLIGDFEQVPPSYSAIKFRGKPLYQYARNGQINLVPVSELKKTVQIQSLKCLRISDNIATFQMQCSKGTYVRVVAAKLAETIGTLGTVSRLLRLSSGTLHANTATKLEDLEVEARPIELSIIPVHEIPVNVPMWHALDVQLVKRLKMGQEMHVDMRFFESGLVQDERIRARITSLDHVLLFDNNGQSFGIGSATVLNTGRIAVRMRRGLS